MKRSPSIIFLLFIAACGNKPSSYSCESSALFSSDEDTSILSSVTTSRIRAPSSQSAAVFDEAVINDDIVLRTASTHPAKLPIWGNDLVRFEGNPVIVGSDVSSRHSFVADPYLLVLNNQLYIFFEAYLSKSSTSRFSDGVGEIWMAESDDGYTWTNFRKVSEEAVHFSHPQALIYDGKVHVFYNYNRDGSVYYRWSPLDSFPNWSEETVVFRGSEHRWHHLVDFTILEHQGIWYLLGITGNQPPWGWRPIFRRFRSLTGWAQDQWIRGRWAGQFTTNWDSESREITPYPLLDSKDYNWLDGIVEITSMQLEDRLWLSMGVCMKDGNGKRSIGTFAITELSPKSYEGVWLTDGFTFPLALSGWDDTDIHRSHAVAFKDRWIYVYDGRRTEEWKIGIAVMPLN